MPSLLLIQWGLVGFFVLFHFIVGFFRGTAKSTYYALVSIVLSFIVLLIVSGISVGSFISNEALIEMIQSNTGNAIPETYVEILSQPEVFAFALAIVDVIVRIVAFLVLYTVIRFVVTFVVFGLLWRQVLKQKVNQWFRLTKVIVKTLKMLQTSSGLVKIPVHLNNLALSSVGSNTVLKYILMTAQTVIFTVAHSINRCLKSSRFNSNWFCLRFLLGT
jgi:hypothetical protein